MKTINVRALQKHVRDCVKASQRDRVVVTRHGTPTALIIGVEGTDWETLALQTNPAFWRMIEQRRSEKTVSLAAMRTFVSTGNH
jgi:prevent-host-death family protein